MSNDDDYAAFLDKANQDTGASKDSGDKGGSVSTKAVDTDVPAHLEKLEVYYVSDADEPFEPVALKHNGKDLTKTSFGKLIGHSGEVEPTDVKQFDPKGKYKEVIDAVSKSSDGNHVVKVFRVELGGTRCEYWLVTIDKDGNVVGVKAKAVES